MRLSPRLLPVTLTLVLLLAFSGVSAGARDGPARLSIIVDDMGYSMDLGRRVIALPGPVTLAVMPFTPYAYALASLAQRSGKDVILHQPMQAVDRNRRFHTANTLTLEMSEETFHNTLAAALDSLPNVVGVNNHTGSLLTQYRRPMTLLMQQIHQRHLFFLDSRTTPATVAATIARETGVPTLQRDTFLDHYPDPASIAAAFSHALDLARVKGSAVIIAHPHEATLAFLERILPQLPQGEFEWVAARTLARPRFARSEAMQLAADSIAPALPPVEGSPHTEPAL